MTVYRILATLFALVQIPSALRKGGIFARFGLIRPDAKGRHVWLHGASVGELTSALPLLRHLADARPDLRWLVTSNTPEGRDTVRRLSLPNMQAELAPFDLAWVLRRVLRRFDIAAHISLETEIWPLRILRQTGPVMLVSARMSERTAASWARFPTFAARVMNRLDLVSAQDLASRTRLTDLGAAAEAFGPDINLKTLYHDDAPEIPAGLAALFDRSNTWLAASTHDGEEELALKAHARALLTDPDLRLIIAPRHVQRAESIADMARALGFGVARRSLGELPAKGQIYLADTMGDMPLWYSLAGRVFIGGSMANHGGHTPFEPVHFGCAILHGPDTAKNTDAYSALTRAGAAIMVHDADAVATALRALADPAKQHELAQRAAAALPRGHNVQELFKLIETLLPRV